MAKAGRKLANYDRTVDRSRGAAERAERTRQAVLEIAAEHGGRVALRPLRAALARRGLPRGAALVRKACRHLEGEGKVEVEVSSGPAAVARFVCLPGMAKKAAPAGGALADLYFAALREEGALEPWGPSMGAGLGGWCRWATVIRLAGRNKDKLARMAEAAGDGMQFAYICRGGRAPTTRQYVRAVPPNWRRWRSPRRALWWLLTWRGDLDGASYFNRPTGARNYKWLQPPGPGYLPLSYLKAVFPSALKGATPARAQRQLRRALRAQKRAGVIELAKAKGGWWVRARPQQAVVESCKSVPIGTLLPERESHARPLTKLRDDPNRLDAVKAGEATDAKVTGEPDACLAEADIMEMERRAFGPSALPSWML